MSNKFKKKDVWVDKSYVAKHLSEGYTFTYGNQTVKIEFAVDDLAGQCGASVLFDFYFPDNFTDESAHSMGVDFAVDAKEASWGAGAKLLASAVVGSTLYHFLNNEHWQKGTSRRNDKTGNNIVIFELDLRSE